MNTIKSLPATMGVIHFIGIGGIGMSGIAEILLGMGYSVQGSDAAESYNTERLRKKGARLFIGHDATHIGGATVVVVSSAIKGDNPEYAAARAAGVPIVHRAEMLAEIMRFYHNVAISGTHGKTTTTTMVYSLLEAGGISPTVINGGILNALSSNARIGDGSWMVVEADESDGSFTRLSPTISVITNMDPEHMEHYGDMDKMRRAYLTFAEAIPFYGLAVLCADHPEVVRLRGQLTNRRSVSYGFSHQADYHADNLRFDGMTTTFDLTIQLGNTKQEVKDLTLNMPGQHNVQNACAAIAVARELGIDMADIRKGLAAFAGVKRRFTLVGKLPNGATVVDDYGHHPVEIAATLKTARGVFGEGKVIAVIQPHRYSRLRDLMADFATCAMEADTVLVAPVYAAGELPIAGIDHLALADRMRRSGHRSVDVVADENALSAYVMAHATQGDGVICLGAGSITKWAQHLVEQFNINAKSATATK
jgi:UDP-N-acetylmuramate--alanine ligase